MVEAGGSRPLRLPSDNALHRRNVVCRGGAEAPPRRRRLDGLIGAGRHDRSGERSTWRNGYRDRSLDTRLGTLNLKIPKLRTGACFPGFLEPGRTVEKALVSVIQEAWIAGVRTRRVDDLVQAMGMSGISKSSVSKLCKDIDERVNAFPKRPLAGLSGISCAGGRLTITPPWP